MSKRVFISALKSSNFCIFSGFHAGFLNLVFKLFVKCQYFAYNIFFRDRVDVAILPMFNQSASYHMTCFFYSKLRFSCSISSKQIHHYFDNVFLGRQNTSRKIFCLGVSDICKDSGGFRPSYIKSCTYYYLY